MRGLFSGLTLLLVGAISACTPYVEVRPDYAVGYNSIDAGLVYADEVSHEMNCMAKKNAKITSWTNNLVIPLSGTTIALGLTGANTDILASTATGVGTIYAIGKGNTNPKFEPIYLAGVAAIDCVKAQATSSMIPKAKWDEFESLRKQLYNTISDTYSLLDNLDLKKYAAFRTSINDKLVPANEFYGKSSRLPILHKQVATKMVVACQRIQREVNQHISENKMTVDSGLAIAKGIGSYYAGSLPLTPPDLSNAKEAVEERKSLLQSQEYKQTEEQQKQREKEALDKIGSNIGLMQLVMRKISLKEKGLEAVVPNDDFSACTIAKPKANVIKIFPETLEITKYKTDSTSLTFVVTGGNPPYSLTWIEEGSTPPQLKTDYNGGKLLITATVNKDTKEKPYNLLVTDLDGINQTVTLRVNEPKE